VSGEFKDGNMTTTEEDLYGALRELKDSADDLFETISQNETADQHLYDRYDAAVDRAELVLRRVEKGE
jgi:hypothetical protein